MAAGNDDDEVGEDAFFFDEVKTFLLNNDISIPNVVDFMRCTQEQQALIMDTFAPENADDTTEDINLTFEQAVSRFLEDASGAVADLGRTSDGIKEFAKTWELGSNSVAILRRLPKDVLTYVIEGFDPPKNTRDINGKLNAFVRKASREVEKGMKKGGKKSSEEAGEEDADPSQQSVDRFATKWGLDDRAVQVLKALDADFRGEIMQSYSPPSNTRDPSSKLMAYIKKMGYTRKSSFKPKANDDILDPLERFEEQWGFDDVAKSRLRELDQDMLDEVIETFAPPAYARDISRTLVSYLNKILRQHGKTQADAWEDAAAEDRDEQSLRDDALEQFRERWSLDDRSIDRLLQMPQDMLEEVISTFSPPEGTRDYNSKLMFFISKFIEPRYQGRGSDRRQESDPRLEQFADYWKLDGRTVERFAQLPLETQEEVIDKFDPPAKARDVNAMLMAFAKARLRKVDARSYYEDAYQDASQTERIKQFAKEFGLHSESCDRLAELSTAQQDEVMAKFAPRDMERDCNPLFLSFVKGRSTKGGGASGRSFNGVSKYQQDEYDIFCDKWQLNEAASERLRLLPEDLRQTVIASFDPNINTRDYSSKLMGFIKAKEKGMGKGGGESLGDSTHWKAAEDRDDSVEDFCEKWELSPEVAEKVRNLAADIRDVIISEFDPPAWTRDVNSKLTAFIRSKEKGSGKGKVKFRGWADDSKEELPESEECEEFAKYYDLSSEAKDVLYQLSPESQSEAIATFAPGADTRDVSGKFISFCKKVLGKGNKWAKADDGDIPRPGRGAWEDNRGEIPRPYRRDDRGVYEDSRGEITRPSRADRGGWEGNRGDNSRTRVSAHEAQKFADKWGIDETAMEWFWELPNSEQHAVLTDFRPRADTRNVSGMFVSYAKSHGAAEPPRKRARH